MKQPKNRTEKDLLGELDLPLESLTGIHSARARENFALIAGTVNPSLIRAYAIVKQACTQTNLNLGYLHQKIAEPIIKACIEVASPDFPLENPLAALQGGAGTSTNMYVNELIANRALLIVGKNPGQYDFISPLEHVNKHQSTNDTYPTALRLAAIKKIQILEHTINELNIAFQEKEKQFANIVKLARTQLQDAVPVTLGQQFAAYAEAFSKDRWRLYKCTERLRVINLGGTAIGTGLGAPQNYIFMAPQQLRQITGIPFARAENLIQATQNCDEFVEVSGILKTLASNIFKIASDLRLLSSGPQAGLAEINLPPRQAGSSIMPGKVNPVIAEMATQAAIQAISHDTAITIAAMNGQLELNAFLPLITHNFLAMIEELNIAAEKLNILLVRDITANPEKCHQYLHNSTAIITAFINKLGYEKASEVTKKAHNQNKTIKQILLEENLCTEDQYQQLTSHQAALALGFRKDRS